MESYKSQPARLNLIRTAGEHEKLRRGNKTVFVVEASLRIALNIFADKWSRFIFTYTARLTTYLPDLFALSARNCTVISFDCSTQPIISRHDDVHHLRGQLHQGKH